MPKIHSGITESDEIHIPKGFTEAANDTALIKDETGSLDYRSLSDLGGTGPQGPAGPSGEDDTARISLSTGLLTGCVLSINGGDNTKYDMTAGTGIHVDNTTTPGVPIITPVTMSAITGGIPLSIATETVTFICFDKAGTLITTSTESSPADRRDLVVVGAVSHSDNVTVDSTFQNPNLPNDAAAQAQDIMQALGFFSTGGNQITGVGGTMTVGKGAGSGFDRGRNHAVNPKDPHNFQMAALTPATLFQILQDTTQVSISPTIDPTQYDNAGVLTTVPANNNATISYIYIFPGNEVVYLFGQEVFSTLSDAIAAAGTETVVVPPDLASGGLLLARVINRKVATDITDANDSKIIASASVSTGGGTITTMQQAYDAGSEPEITLSSTRGALSISDNATPIAAPLFEVQNNAASQKYIEVSTGEVKVETQAYSASNTLADAATIATDCADGNVHTVIITANRTLGAPTNLKDGATYIWIITQDVGGTNTLAYNAVFKFPGGVVPELSTIGNSVDILTGVSDGTNVFCSLARDFK